MCDDEGPAAHAVELADVIGTQAGIGTVDKFGVIQHFQDFLFQRDGGELFAGISRVQTHGDGDSAAVHEESHFNDGVGPVFLTEAKFPQAAYGFAGNLIHHILVGLFAFAVEVCAVIIEDRCVPLCNRTAVFIKPCQIAIVIVCQQIHEPEDVLVIERGLFIIGREPSPCGKFGGRVQDPGIGQEA